MEDIVKKMLSYRTAFMGVAMIAVVLYHFQVWYYEMPIKVIKFILGRGYVGVDIFLFFSAVGLTCSLQKNGKKIFYKHRMQRILPLYLLLAIFRITCNFANGHNLTFTDIIIGISTIGFYIDNGFWIDWYFSLLILLYLLFPLLFFIVRKIGIFSVVLSFGIVFIVLMLKPMPWFHDAALSRIPIFFLGIWLAMGSSCRNYMFVLVLSTLVGFFISMNLSIFLKWSSWVPIIICLLYASFEMLGKQICEFFQFIGRYTLEIYIANCMVGTLIFYKLSLVPLFVVYIVLNSMLAYILVYVQKYFKKSQKKQL